MPAAGPSPVTPKTPTIGGLRDGCAWAASGAARRPPETSAMKVRRFIDGSCRTRSPNRGPYGAWRSRVGSMHEPSLQAGRSLAESVTLRFLSEDVPNNAECALLDCFPLEGCDPLRGAGFSHEGECEQTCHQAGWPVGDSNPCRLQTCPVGDSKGLRRDYFCNAMGRFRKIS